MREMRDSDIKWLGQFPSRWELLRAKNIFQLTNERGNDELVLLAATQRFGMFPQHLLEGVVRVKEDTDLSTFRTVHKNDFVISLRSFQGGFEMSEFEGVCSPAYQTFCAKQAVVHRYYKYLFKCGGFVDYLNSLTQGIREGKTIKYEDFAVCLIPKPPLDEQQRIADYLDAKCAEIDRAIETAEKSIEKYESFRVACVGEAFAAASGPHLKLVYFANTVLGKMLDRSQQRGVNVHRYLANKDVRWFSIESTSLSEMDFPNNAEERYGIRDGDILVCEGGEVGRCAVYRGPSPDFYFQKAIHRVRVNQAIAYPEYIAYQMYAKAKTGNFMEVRKGEATFSHLPGEQLKQLRFTIPSFDEQQRVVDYLDEKCAQINCAIAAKQAIIADLKAYKQSLIYEVVTGKREV